MELEGLVNMESPTIAQSCFVENCYSKKYRDEYNMGTNNQKGYL